MNPTNFYVYGLVDPRIRQVVYIGKGTGDRIDVRHGRNDDLVELERKLRRHDKTLEGVFLKTGLTELESFEEERRLILSLGRKDRGQGVLLNRTNGGEGFSDCTVNKRPFVLLLPYGGYKLFNSIADACREFPKLHAGHISEILNGSRTRNRNYRAMTIEDYLEMTCPVNPDPFEKFMVQAA